MTATNSPNTHHPILKGPWSDAEKIAFLTSIIRSFNTTPKWSTIAVPAGRTLQASAKMYSEMLKASAGVPMTEGESVTPSGKRGRGTDGGEPAQGKNKKQKVNGVGKGKAGGKAKGMVVEVEEVDDESEWEGKGEVEKKKTKKQGMSDAVVGMKEEGAIKIEEGEEEVFLEGV